MTLGFLVALENADKVYPGFLTLDPLKIKISKIALRSDLTWPKSQHFMSLGLFVENANKQTNKQTHRQTDKIHVL